QSTISQSQASCAANTATCAPDPSSRGRPRLIIGAALTSGAGKIGAEGATARGQVPPGPNASASTTVCTGEIRGGPGPVSCAIAGDGGIVQAEHARVIDAGAEAAISAGSR